MHFLPPVMPEKDDTVDTLKQKVFDIMWNYYMMHRK